MLNKHPVAAVLLLCIFLVSFFAHTCTSSASDDVKFVHTVFMNHLDVGFNVAHGVGYSFNVINTYFDVYFPRSLNTSAYFREKGSKDKYIYTTHPFLLSLYLDCPTEWEYPSPGLLPKGKPIQPLHCPSEKDKEELIKAIKRGEISWHAFPFNSEPEFYDSSMFLSSILVTRNLEAFLQEKPSIVMSQRDVPGMTIGAVPLLKQAGVQAISVGVNGGSAPPAVPNAFVWKAPEADVMVMYHPGGYGGINISDVLVVPGLDHALALAFKSDNLGPHTVEEAEQVFDQLRQEFPSAQVFASTFNDFADRLATVKHTLPVIDGEIGDTWIYGVASDPLKTAQYREVLRLRRQCLDHGKCSLQDIQFRHFDRLLSKVGEHTWGMDTKAFLRDWSNWSNDQFERVKNESNYCTMINSWTEQRSFITNAISSLTKNYDSAKHRTEGIDYDNFAQELKLALQNLTVTHAPNPKAMGYEPVDASDFSKKWDLTFFTMAFDPKNGAISFLADKANGHNWANGEEEKHLGKFTCQSFNDADYNKFMNTYSYTIADWVVKDFGKFNVSEANPQTNTFDTQLQALYTKTDNDGNHFLLELTMPAAASKQYGAPKTAFININFPHKQKNIYFDLYEIDKTPTRLPEAHWFSFNPQVPNDDGGEWLISKLGSNIGLTNIVKNGSFHLHNVDDGGAVYSNKKTGKQTLRISSLDTGLLVPGAVTPFPVPFEYPDTSKGFHFNLYNNIWGTNYIMWYPFLPQDANLKYRFVLYFLSS